MKITQHTYDIYASPAISYCTAMPAMSATITVASLADDGGNGELRAAITQANSDAAGDTITFRNGLSGTILLTSALPPFTKGMTIQGLASTTIAIDGAGKYQPIFIQATGATVTIANVTIQHGNAVSVGGNGGAVYVYAGSLALDNCTLSGNTALSGGGIYSFWNDIIIVELRNPR